MNTLKVGHKQVVIPPTPIETDMTLEEFLTLTRKDTLTGADIIEGFSCKISQLFE